MYKLFTLTTNKMLLKTLFAVRLLSRSMIFSYKMSGEGDSVIKMSKYAKKPKYKIQ